MKKIYLILIAFVLVSIFSFATFVKANPSFFERYQWASATTTVAYLNPQPLAGQAAGGSVATTTLNLIPNTYLNQGMDSASVLIQYTGSSTASILAVQPEYSQDNVDWYAMSATSTSQAGIQVFTDYRFLWNYASSTNFGSTTTGGKNSRIFTFPMPTKYARVLLYMAGGSQNGTVWYEAVGKRQVAN